MSKQALNTYLEPGQKTRLERIAKLRKVSQATVVREAVEAYVAAHDPEPAGRSVDEAWQRLCGGYYSGTGRPNDHDEIYR
ncbi:MAG: hypothetical protein AABZ30_14150 [Myxococcota bacterium]